MAAKLIDSLLTAAEAKGTKPKVIDISADYRYATAGAYEAVYKHAHGAPARIAQFTCAVPEHLDKLTTPHAAHPGCFATAVLLASVPLLKLGLSEPRLFACGITGSTGSGRTPGAGTHHPQRHSDLYAYNPLSHRHTPEITALATAASQVKAEFNFVPHSGPFARGIHRHDAGDCGAPDQDAGIAGGPHAVLSAASRSCASAATCRTSRTSPAATMRS